MIRESEVTQLLDDLDHLLVAIGSSHSPALTLIGRLRLNVLDMLAAADPDPDPTTAEWEPYPEPISPLPSPEPLPRRYRVPVSYDKARKVSCPKCGAKRGEDCFIMKRRGDERALGDLPAKHPHDERKQKVRDSQ